MDRQKYLERIHVRMEALNIKVPQLVRMTGIPTETMWRFVRGSFKRPPGRLIDVARVLQCPLDWLIGDTDEFPLPRTPGALPGNTLQESGTAAAATTTGHLPLYQAMPADDHRLIMVWQPADWVPAPPPLLNAAGSFAFDMIDDSMMDAYAEGERLFLHPGLLPRVGNDAMFMFNRDSVATLGRVVDKRPGAWVVRHLKDGMEELIQKSDVRSVATVVVNYKR